MNENEATRLEAELGALRPARPSAQSLNRLLEQVSPRGAPRSSRRAKPAPGSGLMTLLRWLVPAAATASVVVAWKAAHWSPANTTARRQIEATAPDSLNRSETNSNFAGLRADKVEIDRQLVAQFETVARLPDGQPLRVRCERWMDTIQLRDSSRGLVLERTAPRLEIVPIAFEMY
jgi:hypothetical protein